MAKKARRQKDPVGLEALGLILLDIIVQRDLDFAWAFGDDFTVWQKAADAVRALGYPEQADEILAAAREQFPDRN